MVGLWFGIGFVIYGVVYFIQKNKMKNKGVKMKKSLLLSIVASTMIMAGGDIVSVEPVEAVSEINTVNDNSIIPKEYGTLSGNLKLMHVLDGKDNGYDKNTGSVYYLNLGYTTPVYNGFSLKVSGSVVGDTGLTDEDKAIAAGMFMGDVTSDPSTVMDTYIGFEDIFLKYQNDSLDLKLGHFKLDTPMTKNVYSTVPNLYEGITFTLKKILPETTLAGAYLTRMSYGAKSLTDWGLIGEKIDTMTGSSSWAKTNRGEFEDFGTIIGKDSTGIVAVGLTNKSLKNTTIRAWDYYASDIVNIIYIDTISKYKFKDLKVGLGTQLLYEDIDGGDTPVIYGLKASVGYGNAKLALSYNKSNSDQLVNPWGGSPLYTTSIFSANGFRPDVSAYKVSGVYKIPALKTTISMSYADYGKSSLDNVQDDATERDIVVKYKPTKKVMVKLFNANRTSEFNGLNGADKTQNHTRVVFSYKF